MGVAVRKLMVNDSASFPIVTYITGSAGSSTSFSNVSIGTASSDRLVVVVVTTGNGSNTTLPTPTAVSIAGTNGTIHVSGGESEGTGGNANAFAIASRLVTSGTTATISITANGTVSSCAIQVYTITGYQSATPVATYSGTNADPINLVFGSHPTGVAVGGAIALSPTDIVFSTTGSPPITEDYDVNTLNRRRASFHMDDASGSPTISAAFTGSNNDECFCAAVWE